MLHSYKIALEIILTKFGKIGLAGSGAILCSYLILTSSVDRYATQFSMFSLLE